MYVYLCVRVCVRIVPGCEQALMSKTLITGSKPEVKNVNSGLNVSLSELITGFLSGSFISAIVSSNPISELM